MSHWGREHYIGLLECKEKKILFGIICFLWKQGILSWLCFCVFGYVDMTEMHNSPIISCNSPALQARPKKFDHYFNFLYWFSSLLKRNWKIFKTHFLQILQLLRLLQPPKEVVGKDGGNCDNIGAPEPYTRTDIHWLFYVRIILWQSLYYRLLPTTSATLWTTSVPVREASLQGCKEGARSAGSLSKARRLEQGWDPWSYISVITLFRLLPTTWSRASVKGKRMFDTTTEM